jgi:hypothetical protein
MFCPRCGQQQASEEVRFCSRCGLQLDELSGFIENGGRLAAVGGGEQELPALTPRQRGTRKGLLFFVGGLIFGLIAVFLAAAKNDFVVLLLPAGLVIAWGLMRMLYAMLLEDDAARKKAARREALGDAARVKKRDKLADARDKLEGARGRQLPPQRSVPASAFAKSNGDTSDMATPPSVTENTTKLLEED